MTLKIYIGTADEITARLAGTPSTTTSTVASATSTTVFDLTSATSFAEGDSIVIGKEKGVISDLTGVTVTLAQPLKATPDTGATVRHYNADYTKYRDQSQPFTFIDDRKTGGRTGQAYGQDLVLNDYDGLMPDIIEQNRITIFDSVDDDAPLFAGVIVASERIQITKTGNTPIYQWLLECQGYQWEADSIGIEEQPYTNINAGEFLEIIRSKWSNLSIGEIDSTNSPTIDYIRLANNRRFSEVGQSLAEVWPGSEFYIANGHTGGSVYFRQQVTSFAPITLSQSYLETVGNRADQYVRIRTDYDKVFNIVTLPYYKEQTRDPDFHVQDTVSDDAFLRTSVILAGQPASIEQSDLVRDDFADSSLSSVFIETDIDNPSPPTGFTNDDGYLLVGDINGVKGLHLLDAYGVADGFWEIGIQTDPSQFAPFDGKENQTLLIQEFTIDLVGFAMIGGIIDQTTVTETVLSGSTTSHIYVADESVFTEGDRITVDGMDTFIINVTAGDLTVTALPSAPDVGSTITLHPFAKSRVKFGIYFTESGNIKRIQNGSEQSIFYPSFPTLATYDTEETYSFRWYMQCFETTVASGASSTGVTLADATNFTTGDVVEIYTQGSRVTPERRVITKSGSDITYSATNATPAVGYRVRTLPKLVLQIKGGAYGDINGRDWATLYTSTNTWQTSATTDRPNMGLLLCANYSIAGTMGAFIFKDPPGVTANIGTRYLHIGTQEVDSAEPDIDCIIRKVGSHYQLDFFPDTKELWGSGETLELRYNERWRLHLESKDTESMRDLAAVRGYTIPEGAREQTLVKLGGRALDSIDILPTPITDTEALSQSEEILSAVSSPAYTAEIVTNTVLDDLCQAGQTIKSNIPGIPDMVIERVEITEIPGIQNADGGSIYRQKILAGTVDRLTDILSRRVLTSNKRIVIDDGVTDDSYSKIQKVGFTDRAIAVDSFEVSETPFFLIDENGDFLITEDGDFIISG